MSSCGEIVEYNQAVANVGVQPPAAGGALDGYPVGGGAFPPNVAFHPVVVLKLVESLL